MASELNKKIQLNKAQQEAVNTIYGPVMVVAGPGTGKTTILSLRIAEILKQTDCSPDSILAITFTDAGVVSMRKKLLEQIGKDAYQINITTFHGYCNSLIKNFPEYFPEIISSQLANDSEILTLIEEIIDSNDWEYIKPSGDKYNYVSFIKSAISHLKREDYDSKKYNQYLKKYIEGLESDENNYSTRGKTKGQLKSEIKKEIQKAEKSQELSHLFEIFEKKKQDKKIFDYEDLIISVLKKLEENDNLLASQQEKFQFILVDEHQDSNFSQNKLLEILTSFDDNPNLFIVGDEKQAIFRFQGASLENFLYFHKKFPNAKIIKLTENYRSNQSILDASFSLIKNNPIDQNFFIELKNANQKDLNKIEITKYQNPDHENFSFVEDIKQKIKEGVSENEIAIIYRKHEEVDDIVRFLESAGLKFNLKTNKNLLLHYDIRKLHAIFKIISNLHEESAISELLVLDYINFFPADVHKIIEYSKQNKVSLLEIFKNKEILNTLNITNTINFINLGNDLYELAKTARIDSATTTFVKVLNTFKILDEIFNSDTSLQRMQKINMFFEEAKEIGQKTIQDFLTHLEKMNNYNLEIKDKSYFLTEGVNLMSAHGAKGLEFDYVYIPHLVKKYWGEGGQSSRFILPYGDFSQSTKNKEIEDERRLLFVAMTRARKQVKISYFDKDLKGNIVDPSLFLLEIDPKYSNENEIKEVNNSEIFKAKFSLVNKISDNDKKYLQEVFLNQPLSVSALNNYLDCPWKYFYRNLIRIPDTYNTNQIYGNLIHKAISLNSQIPFQETFNKELQKILLPAEEKQKILEKLKKNLQGLLKIIDYKNADQVISELDLHNSSIEFEEGKIIKLKGLIDHLVITGNELMVIDYKTGKIKSEKEIKGETKNSDGNYYRQLVFYKMLLQDSKYKNFNFKEARIQFTGDDEGTEKGFSSFSFYPSENEVRDLLSNIKNVAQDIYNFNFWDKKCDKDDCEFCNLPKPK